MLNALAIIWISLLVTEPVFSPRVREVFAGKPMVKSSVLMPLAVVVPPATRYTNSFKWSDVGNNFYQLPSGFKLVQYAGTVTNVYHTDKTNITIVYMWPDSVERWFYYVVATNAWGDSDPSNVRHLPLYPADRADLYVKSVPSFTLQTSTDRRTWTASLVSGRATVMLSGPQRYFRVQGLTNRLEIDEYNPLNQ